MALLDIPLDRITEADLLALVQTGARESVVIEYKRDTYGRSDDAHSEFLADISSLANTLGGDLVIGVAATQGIPQTIAPFQGDADAELLRLEGMARSALQPRLPQLTARAVPVPGGNVLVLRARRSFTAPHRVIFKNRNRFWARASSGKYEPDVTQLRRMFNEGLDLVERIRDFRTQRLRAISAGDRNIQFHDVSKAVLHVVPLPAFEDGRFADLFELFERGTHVPLPLSGVGASRTEVNLDGLFFPGDTPGQRVSYAQFFRSGVIEGVMELQTHPEGGPYVNGAAFARTLVRAVKQYTAVLSSYEAGEPVYAFISLVSISGARLGYPGLNGAVHTAGPFRAQDIALPEVLLDFGRGDVPMLLRPALNMLWNAFGLPRCGMYGPDGRWLGGP